MKKTPLTQVKERFKDKEALVAAVQKLASDDLWLDRVSEDKGLAHVSNAKLLRIHDVLTAVQKEFGSREKLIAAITDLEKRSKDEDYRSRYASWPTPRPWDRYQECAADVADTVLDVTLLVGPRPAEVGNEREV